MEGLLKNPMLENENFLKLFPGFDVEKDQSPLVAAILRFVIGKPNGKLSKLYEECVGFYLSGENSLIKVGIQIRNGDPGLSRFEDDKFDRFVTKLLQDFPVEHERQNIFIFDTGDSNDKFNSLIEKLRKVKFQVITSGETFPQLQFSHVDRNSGQWLSEAKTYLDWYALTQMDRLYISRSGFGETAALISMVPTQHFTCVTMEWKFHPFPFLTPFNINPKFDCWKNA